jgi:hypothetical protein
VLSGWRLEAHARRIWPSGGTAGERRGNAERIRPALELLDCRAVGTVRVNILGPLTMCELTEAGAFEELPRATSANARRLIAILALETGPHNRAEIIDRLWPGVDLGNDVINKSARGRLKTEIGKARRALGSAGTQLTVDPGVDQLQLSPKEEVLELDLQIERDARIAEQVDVALGLHRGEILQGWDERWLDYMRGTQRTNVARLLRAKHDLDEPFLSLAVDAFLRYGGAAWLENSDELIAGVVRIESRNVRRVADALARLQPAAPAFPAAVEDRPAGPIVVLAHHNNARPPIRIPIDRVAVGRLDTIEDDETVLMAAFGDDTGQVLGPR